MVHNSVEEHISQLNSVINQRGIWNEAAVTCLKKLTTLMRSFDTRSNLRIDHWKPIELIVKEGRQSLTKSNLTENEMQLLIDLLRFLRNSCGGLNENVTFILNHSEIMNFAKETLEYFLQKQQEHEITVLKIAIQLFGNIVVGSVNSKPLIWNLFFYENKFSISDDNCECIFKTKEGNEIVHLVTDTLLTNQIDWGLLFIEQLLSQKDFLDCCYEVFPLRNRLLILEIMDEKIKDKPDEYFISESLVESVKNYFLKNITQICSMKDSNIDPAEILYLLSILCSASISPVYAPILQNSKDLLQSTVETLKCIHLLGKEDSNAFSSVQDLKHHTDSQLKEEMLYHPFYGFKRNLIRLIGNVCYGYKDNQDIVRNLDGIPLILDCCKFDAKIHI
ncbi:ataxin-10 [Caerostris extrusa]|uniref:Ataxin-10 n=1 Tax=Caerostris extrusa TaxID=172846 RepID=A0AAV4XL64_CAEEX|nr:ataxin-10 [Caerostris extrusa]